jgi:hypothetical protein
MGLDDFDSTVSLNPTFGVDPLKNADNQNRRSRKKTEQQLKRKSDSVEFSSEPPAESSPAGEPTETQQDYEDPTLSGAFIDITI